MAARRLDGIIYAATGASDADNVAGDAGLRDQILKRDVDVAGKFFVHDFRRLIGREFVEWVAGTFAEAAIVQGEHVDSRLRELLSQAVPNFALAVALVQ